MPISPQERSALRAKNLKPAFDAECAKIDAYLLRDDQREYWYSVHGLEPQVIADLKIAYHNAGWDVRINSDQRDGYALVFKERK